MASSEFERAVLRELDQIRDLISDALREVRVDRERQDEELSELRLQVDRLARMSQPPGRKGWARDGGLTVSAATIGALLTALSQWLAQPQPAPPAKAPAALIQER